MEQNVEDPTPQAEAAAEKPVRRRASRRVSAAAGTPAAEPATTAGAEAQAPAAAVAPAAAEAAAEAPAEAPKKRVTRSRKKVAEPEAAVDAAPAAESTPAADAGAAEPAAEAPKKRATRSRKKVVDAEAPAAEAAAAPAETAAEPAAEAPKRGRRRASAAAAAPEASAEPAADASAVAEPKTAAAKATESNTAAANDAATKDAAAKDAERTPAATKRSGKAAAASAAADAEATEEPAESKSADAEPAETGRGRNRRNRGQKTENTEQSSDAEKSDAEPKARDQKDNARNGENSSRSSRTRQRDRKRRGQGDEFEPEITEDDVLLPIAGILDVLDNYAFVRTSGYLPGTSDVYVSLGQVKKYGMRRGDAVVGAIRQPRDGESGSRQKYNAIVKIDSVNGRSLEENEQRVDVSDLTAIYPKERLRLETDAAATLGRTIDLVAPVGLGQRGLIVAPAGVQTTRVVSEIAAAVSANAPEAHLIVVLTHAQPEEVTRLQRSVRGEVVAATFDRAAEDQTTIAELAIDRARRLVELGHDVVVLVDSLNRLARGYAQTQPAAARPALDVIDEHALAQVAALLSAARNLENGGSLTLLATVQTKTGVDADKQLLREALLAANSVIRLSGRGFGLTPEVDVTRSHTLGAEDMLGADEARVLAQLQSAIAADDDAADVLAAKLRSTSSNAALLAEVQRVGGLS